MSLVSLVMAVHDPTPLEQRVSEDRYYMYSVPQYGFGLRQQILLYFSFSVASAPWPLTQPFELSLIVLQGENCKRKKFLQAKKIPASDKKLRWLGTMLPFRYLFHRLPFLAYINGLFVGIYQNLPPPYKKIIFLTHNGFLLNP